MTTYRLTKRGRVLGLAVYVLAAYIASGVHR